MTSTPSFPFTNALTIGTTGMLSGALEEVAKTSASTAAVSRHATSNLHGLDLPRTKLLDIDYSDPADFMDRLEQEIDLSSIDLALVWVHNSGLEVLWALLERFSTQPMRIVHVAGSAAGDPERQTQRITSRITFGPQTEFIPVILGTMPDGNDRRWLTHKEICTGTIKAIRSGTPQMVGHRLTDFDDAG